MLLSIIMLAFIFVIGLCVGSFMNVVILRTVSEESIVFPGSKCPKCQTPLKWYHNIPVFSYLFLRGKCGFCKERISIQYPIVELITGILFIALFLRFCNPFDPIFGLSIINPISPLQITIYIFSLIVTCLFIAIAGTDILEKKVSDAHTLPLIGIGILYSVVFSIISFIGSVKASGMPKIDLHLILTCPIIYCLAAAIMGFLIIEAISRLGQVTVGARAFGEGDSYIAAGIGSVFGALLGFSPLYNTNFGPIFQVLFGILVLAGVLQLLVTIPVFIKKLITSKSWVTLGSLAGFALYTIAYMYAQHAGWLNHKIAYWASLIVLLAIGLFSCGELILGLKENKAANGLYLPFGLALVLAGLIALFTIGF